jgi:hypothetical protein
MQSAILWRGPSELDRAPITVIATGLDGARNRKTGPGLIQTYIIRSDMAPIEASRTGADASICGDCQHRGKADGTRAIGRSCYVNLSWGPSVVYRTMLAGRYDHLDVESAGDLFRGRRVRLGTYGDPAAVPISFWSALLTNAGRITGYTHQWRRFPEFSSYCMASADSADDRAAARMLGFRTFRVLSDHDTLDRNEVSCPASAEAGHRTTCAACLACGGNSSRARADIAIRAHGVGAAHYLNRYSVVVTS